MNSSVTVMTNIDHNRSSQQNYHKKKQSPYTQYGPYSNNGDAPDFLSANGDQNNHFEMLSNGGSSAHKSPATMQEFQHQSVDGLPEKPGSKYGTPSDNSNVQSHHKIKNKYENMRKKNINNVANNILSSGKQAKPVRAQQMRAQSVDDETSDSNSNHKMVTETYYVML
jgi:hypothetical protein